MEYSGLRRAFRLPQCRSSRRTDAKQRGVAAIEFALVLPIMITLLLGVIDFGFTFANWLAVRDGSREGARQAVVAETGGVTSCTVIGAGAMSSSTLETVCLTKDSVGLDEGDVRVKIVVGNYLEGERLAVCVQYPADSLTGFFGPVLDDKVVRSKVQMRIEELGTPALGSMQETPHDGSNWAWCVL